MTNHIHHNSEPAKREITAPNKKNEKTIKPMIFLAGDIGISFQASSLTLP